MILTGDSLADRQHDLNTRVSEAAAKEIPLAEYMEPETPSDVDKLFKIDLASKYKNIDYIIDVLKSGDELYISRAIRCLWLYDAEYKSYINPSFLQENVFPLMSAKMMKKFLVKTGTYVSDEEQAQDFFEYCLKKHMGHYAFNFLINTSMAFKADVINNRFTILSSLIKNINDIIFFIGNDFTLAELYQKKEDSWYTFRHLYSVDDELYLSKWENLFDCGERPTSRLGLRASKDIMLKHKNRILNKIHLYYKLVNFRIFLKYTTLEDAKLYAAALLPETSAKFWSSSYRSLYSPILDMIPEKEKYHFFKNIYVAKYPDSEFEMTKGFYEQMFYDLMTVDEREAWALRFIESPKKSFLSEDEDKEYLWYRFVTYDKAIPVIKKYVLITPDPDKRAKIVNILIESTRNQDHLQNMFEYYYERHINEDRSIKEIFIKKVIKRECIWEFNDKCWEAFSKLLHSIELFNEKDDRFLCNDSKEILIPVLFYYIFNEQELPKTMTAFLEEKISVEYENYAAKSIKKMKDSKQKVIIYEYLKEMCIYKIKKEIYHTKNFDDYYLVKYIDFTLTILSLFGKTNEELPEVVNFIISISKKEHPRHVHKRSKRQLKNFNSTIKLLKDDVKEISSFWESYNYKRYFKIGLLKKLKVYFSQDLAKEFVKHFSDIVLKYETSETKGKNVPISSTALNGAVQGLFLLADESVKTELVTKYAPTESKIDYKNLDRNLLYIQEAICKLVFYSRPRVPLEHVSLYIKGDYIHYCLPLLYNYTTNLPLPQCLKFINVLLKAPVSIQKHGLRLAFDCFSLDDLKKLVLKTWKLSKNISLRMVIYTHLVNNIIYKREDGEKKELFDILLTFTSQLNEEDHPDVLSILTNDNDFPEHLINDYLKTAWKTINKFPDDCNINLTRKCDILKNMKNNIHLMDYHVVLDVLDDFIKDFKEYILQNNLNCVMVAKYNLMTAFFANFDDEDALNNSIRMLQNIMSTCFETWNDVNPSSKEKKNNISRSFCHKFLKDLEAEHFALRKKKNIPINVLFQYIARNLFDTLPLHEVFSMTLRLQFVIMTNIILDNLSKTANESNTSDLEIFTSVYAAEVIEFINGLIGKQQFNLILLKDVSYVVISFADRLNNLLLVPISESHTVDRYRYNPMDPSRPQVGGRRKWVKWNPANKNRFRNLKPLHLTKRQNISTRQIPVASFANVQICIAKELLGYNTTESMLLAIEILPLSIPNNMSEDYEYIVQTVENSNNFAVKTSFYKKEIKYN